MRLLCLIHTNMLDLGILRLFAHRSICVHRHKYELSSYCVDFVKRYDYENYLCTLLLPAHVRPAVFAVRAFNAEVARVRDNVSESRAGAVRLQFWSDSVDRIFSNDPPQQPVALALHQATKRHRISRGWLKRLVEARQQTMKDAPFTTIRSMEEYSVNAFTPVHYLVLQCLDKGMSVSSEHLQLASRLGRAQGVSSLLRATPALSARRLVQLPTQLLRERDVSAGQLLRGGDSPAVREVVFQVASSANLHIQHVRQKWSGVPTELRAAFLPAVCVSRYLLRLQRAQFNVFHPALQRRDGWLPFILYWHSLRRSI